MHISHHGKRLTKVIGGINDMDNRYNNYNKNTIISSKESNNNKNPKLIQTFYSSTKQQTLMSAEMQLCQFLFLSRSMQWDAEIFDIKISLKHYLIAPTELVSIGFDEHVRCDVDNIIACERKGVNVGKEMLSSVSVFWVHYTCEHACQPIFIIFFIFILCWGSQFRATKWKHSSK